MPKNGEPVEPRPSSKYCFTGQMALARYTEYLIIFTIKKREDILKIMLSETAAVTCLTNTAYCRVNLSSKMTHVTCHLNIWKTWLVSIQNISRDLISHSCVGQLSSHRSTAWTWILNGNRRIITLTVVRMVRVHLMRSKRFNVRMVISARTLKYQNLSVWSTDTQSLIDYISDSI